MSDQPEDPQIGHPDLTPGAQVKLEVFQSALRTTLFPDQSVVLPVFQTAPSRPMVEIVFVRQEPVIVAQTLTVDSVGDGSAAVRTMEASVSPRIMDIGHVRMPLAAAADMALNIIRELLRGSEEPGDALRASLQTVLETTQ